MASPIVPNSYALAHGLRGFTPCHGYGPNFAVRTLRVLVTRVEGRYVWVRTADLADAGTELVLDVGQVEAEPSTSVDVVAHRDGLVTFDAS